jgi:hypothetical protein
MHQALQQQAYHVPYLPCHIEAKEATMINPIAKAYYRQSKQDNQQHDEQQRHGRLR